MSQSQFQDFNTFDVGNTTDNPVMVSGRFLRYLHNLKVEVMRAKIDLRFNPEKPQNFLQEEATLVGQLQLLEEILANTTPSEDA